MRVAEEFKAAAVALMEYYKNDVLVDLHKIVELTNGPRPENPFPVIHGLLMESYKGEEEHIAKFNEAHLAFAAKHGIEIIEAPEESEELDLPHSLVHADNRIASAFCCVSQVHPRTFCSHCKAHCAL